MIRSSGWCCEYDHEHEMIMKNGWRAEHRSACSWELGCLRFLWRPTDLSSGICNMKHWFPWEILLFIARTVFAELNIYIIIWNRVASLASLCVCFTYKFVSLSTDSSHFLETRGRSSVQISVRIFPIFPFIYSVWRDSILQDSVMFPKK